MIAPTPTDPRDDQTETWRPRRGPIARLIAWLLLAVILLGIVAMLVWTFGLQ